MLRQLTVRDLALVERASLELVPGLCVLTGETGAGKSLLVAAIAALRGGRVGAEVVRGGAEAAVVEGVFEGEAVAIVRPELEAAGVVVEEELVLRRMVSRDGRSRAFVNDQAVTLATLRGLSAVLIDLHGQHEHQVLLDETQHARLLDEAAGLGDAAGAVRAGRAELKSAAAALAQARAECLRIARAAADLEEVAAEVEALNPEAGEIEALRAERETLRHRDRIIEGLRNAGRLVAEEDGSALERVGIAEGLLRHLEGLDPALVPAREQLFEARVLLEDAARAAEHRLAELDCEPGRLEAIEDRLVGLERLVRRHGSVERAREVAEAARRDLDRLADSSEDEERERVDGAAAALDRAARELSRTRGAAAKRLARAVAGELKALGFPGGAFEVALEPRPAASAAASATSSAGSAANHVPGDPLPAAEHLLDAIGDEGRESVRFLLAPNPGEGLHALGRTAAGGELARVMLALRTALRGGGGAHVLVFDEVDSGVGGIVLDAVADRLAALAGEGRQVLCVTHQARIAARAHLHLRVDKVTGGGRTATRITPLDRDGRLAELERLLAGREPGPRAAALAEELLGRHRPQSPSTTRPAARPRAGSRSA